MPLLRFGESGATQSYTFPVTLGAFSTNFADAVQRAVRLPGANGGFDTYGLAVAPTEIGNITQTWGIYAAARDGAGSMTPERDIVLAMAGWGKKRLWLRPTNYPTLADRWCWARISSIRVQEDVGKHTDLFQTVTATWQVTDPRWYSQGNENSVLWGSGFNWGNAASVWSGTTAGTAVSGTSTSFTITPSGSAETHPRIIVSTSGAQTATNVRVQRLVSGVAVDEVQYIGTIPSSSSLEINCRTYTVTLAGVSVYSSFSFSHPAWMRLQPGANTIRVLMANSGDAATVKVLYYDSWY